MKTQISEIQEISEKREGCSLLLLNTSIKMVKKASKSKIERFHRKRESFSGIRDAAELVKNELQPL